MARRYALDTGVANLGVIRAELATAGRIIQHPDMWVASLARQYGFTVATTDTGFARISALTHEIWP